MINYSVLKGFFEMNNIINCLHLDNMPLKVFKLKYSIIDDNI